MSILSPISEMFATQQYLVVVVLVTSMYQRYIGEFILGALGVAIMFLSNKFLYNTFDWLYTFFVWIGWVVIIIAVLSSWGVISIFDKEKRGRYPLKEKE